jgi:lysyl-tRNA synthetase class 2
VTDQPQPPTNPPSDAPAETEPHHLEKQRRDNRDKLIELGLDPYGSAAQGPEFRDSLISLASAHAAYSEAADEANKAAAAARKQAKKDSPDLAEDQLPLVVDDRPAVNISGRVMLSRDNGKLVWLNIRDHSGDLQIAVSKRDCSENGFALAKGLDLGDLVTAHGPLTKTKAGEITVWADDVRPASKCLVPPPEKWSGLQDVEQRYRQRYIDLWANPDSMKKAIQRAKMVTRTRRFLDARGFLEVETPSFELIPGGAAARPFVTHINAFDLDLYMRIATELNLKRLLVGGLPRVYELGRIFRNEGVDRTHNPEFTTFELYEAHGNYETMRELTESLFRDLTRLMLHGLEGGEAIDSPHDPASPLVIEFDGTEIDYAKPFEIVKYEDVFSSAIGVSMRDEESVKAAATHKGIKLVNPKGVALDHWLIVNQLFEQLAENTLDPSRPTFVIDYPAALCPLTRPKRDDPVIAERFELYIAGMELANAYTELNDPDIQEAKFREQVAGLDDEESNFRNLDEDFIHALKVGMPPAGGLGVGIDRLAMLLTGSRTIRDVILFPLMRPTSPGS